MFTLIYQATSTSKVGESTLEYKLIFTEKTTSPSLGDAIELAKSMPNYKQEEGKHIVAVTKLELAKRSELSERFCELVGMTGRWSATRVEVDGKKIQYRELSAITCHYDHKKDCNGICRWLGFSNAGVRGLWGPRYGAEEIGITQGKFDEKGIFHVNKKRIKENVSSEIKRSKYKYCPILNRKKIFKKIDELPDSVDLRSDFEWTSDDIYGGISKKSGPQIPEVLLKEKMETLVTQREEELKETMRIFAESLKPAIKEAFVEAMNEVLAKEGKTAKKVFRPQKEAKK